MFPENINIQRLGDERNHNYHSRAGIILDNLPYMLRKLLIKHRHIKPYVHQDNFLKCLYATYKTKIYNSSEEQYYFDWYNYKPVSLAELKENYDYVDWYCAISGQTMQAKFMNFEPANFVHPDHQDILTNQTNIDRRIVDASIEFRKYCVELLTQERNRFIKVKRKAKGV